MLWPVLVMALAGGDPFENPLPSGATPLSEPGRYKISKTFDEAIDFYQRLFQTGGVRWRNVVNLPGIRAKHIESLRKKTTWEGINLYEHKGEVKIYVIPRSPEPTGAAKPAEGKKK